MTSAFINRFARKLHLWLGIAIGVQLGLWLVSGLFMTLFPIEAVRGTHLRTDIEPVPIQMDERVLAAAAIVARVPDAQSVTLQSIDSQLVYVSKTVDGTDIRNAVTGEPFPQLTDSQARRIAKARYAGEGQIGRTTLYETHPPREYGRAGPVWQVNFEKPDKASFYVDAKTGEVKAVRTGLWRTFDFMWGLHIMDWKSRENFNSWWIKSTALIAVIFFLSGLCLIILRLRSALKRRRKKSISQTGET